MTQPEQEISGGRVLAVLIPCCNEEQTVAAVVEDFRAALPDATIYVYDNNSTDATARLAAEAGAVVRREDSQGKGHVVRRMFADVDADVFVLVDGDGTYEAADAPAMVEHLLRNHLAMVVGRRVHSSEKAYRRGHRFGNESFTAGVAWIFGRRFTDIFSGYRVFSRRFVKSFPASAQGFEVEAEFTVHALTLDLPTAEIETRYKERPEGAASKLHTFRDGLRIIWKILSMFESEKPLAFFGILGVVLVLAAIFLAYPVVVTYLDTGLVPRFPTAFLAMGLTLAGLLSMLCGLILDSVAQGRLEVKRLAYLACESRCRDRKSVGEN